MATKQLEARDSTKQLKARDEVTIRAPTLWNQRELGFLVLCSGARRDGDLCQMVEMLAYDHGVAVVAVAVDPLADKAADLIHLDFLEHLIADIAAGKF
eukprot:2335933-Karenia_brevis.AAC.1